MRRSRTCADALIDLLAAYGVDVIFGIPGVHTLDLYRALGRSGLRHVSVRHEQGAGFAADGYARITGRPGVCLLISGPGVTNAMTPMGQAYADSIPMLVISSDNPTDTLGRGMGYLHEVSDLAALTRPVTALSAVATSPDVLPKLVARAFELFSSERPRPVHIIVPRDVLAAETEAVWLAQAPPSPPSSSDKEVAAAAALLQDALHPLIIAGGGVRTDDGAVGEISLLLGAPVLATNAGKGIVSADHPLSLGSMISRPSVQRYLAEADAVLVLGSELAETDSYAGVLPISQNLIRVDIDENQFSGLYRAALPVKGDAATFAKMLRDYLKDTSPPDGIRFEKLREEVKCIREAAREATSPREKGHLAAIEAIQAALPAGTIAVGDMTQIVYSATAFWEVDKRGRWHYAAGFCTLGCALPMGIGAKIASPDSAVVVLVGDAGFQFTLPELATAIEEELPLTVVIWNNDGLGAIRAHMDKRDISHLAVDYQSGNPDFVQLAAAYGCRGERPDTLEELTIIIQDAVSCRRPILIDLREAVALAAVGDGLREGVGG